MNAFYSFYYFPYIWVRIWPGIIQVSRSRVNAFYSYYLYEINNNNNRRLVTLAEHTSDHGRQTNSSTEEKGDYASGLQDAPHDLMVDRVKGLSEVHEGGMEGGSM